MLFYATFMASYGEGHAPPRAPPTLRCLLKSSENSSDEDLYLTTLTSLFEIANKLETLEIGAIRYNRYIIVVYLIEV